MKPLSLAYQILLIIAVVLAVFYPSFFAEISLVDDAQAITAIFKDDHLSLRTIFLPSSVGGGYYRPLIGLSYWIDKNLWFLKGTLMHFEQVLAHLLNGLLVFLITREAAGIYLGRRDTYTPLAAALLFSLHPIVTESVNWISGRTDVMMGNFVLLSFFLLLIFKQTRSRLVLILSVASAMIALLAKEAAFGYLIALPLLLSLEAGESPVGKKEPTPLKKKIYLFCVYYCVAFFSALYLGSFWAVLVVASVYVVHNLHLDGTPGSSVRLRFFWVFAALVGTVALFFIIRRIAFKSDVDKIGLTIKLMFADINYTISLFVGAFGFYVKKFFLPLPLNFFIIEIDPLYDFIGIAVLLIALYLLSHRSLPALFVLTGIFLVLPALPFAFGTIAWTAYAERYIYLATAFWTVACCLWGARFMDGMPDRVGTVATALTGCIILVCSGVSYGRNMVWQTNVALLRDTVAHNPKNRMLRDMYMAALLNDGDIMEAKRQYSVASRLPAALYKNHYDDRADLIMAEQLIKEGHHEEALQLYENALLKTKYGSEPILVGAVNLLKTMKRDATDEAERGRRAELLRDYADRLKKITSNPALLIEFGKEAMKEGSYDDASRLFSSALRNMSPNDRLRPLVTRLQKQALSK
jgi:protein O-mannosyl-transferase